MPTVRKLTPEEITERNAPKMSQRKRIANEYDSMIAGFEPGEWGELELSEEDNRLTIRNRLLAAAGRRNLHLSFHRSSGNMMRFVVEEAAPAAKVVAATDAENAPKKRGRKPRVAV